MELLLVNYQVSEEPRGLIYILVNYTFHTRCISKSSAVLIIHLTFQPQQNGGKLNMHITTPESNEGLQKCC